MNSWPIKKLIEVCSVFADGDWIESKDQSESGIRLIQTGNIGRLFFINKSGKARYISKETFKRLDCTEIFPGDILVSRLPDPVGRACIIPNLHSRMITAVDCTIIRPKANKIVREFLLYLTELPLYRSQIENRLSGTTRKRISKSNLGEIEIYLPPLETQKKIVGKIEKLFAKIDEAQKLREEAKKDTDTLLQSTMNEIFSSVESKKWSRKKLNEICIKITDGSHLPPQEVENGEMMLSSRNIYDDGINFQRYRKISKTDFEEENKRTNISPGDILFTCVGSIGRCLVVPPNAPKFTLQRSVAVIKPKDELNSKYLAYCLKSPSIQERVFQKSRGAAQQGIYLKDIKNLEIQLPTLKIQKQIVARLDKLTEKVRELQKLQSETAADFINLKQSILEKAFKGEL